MGLFFLLVCTAIAFTADRLSEIKEQHGPDALGLVAGDWLYTLPTYSILKLWFSALGSTSYAGNGYFYNKESAGVAGVYGDGTCGWRIVNFPHISLGFPFLLRFCDEQSCTELGQNHDAPRYGAPPRRIGQPLMLAWPDLSVAERLEK